MDEMIEKVKNGYSINIYKDKSELSTAAFKFIESQIIRTLKNKERFKFCVSGGSTPKAVYKLLSKSDLRWDMVDVFLGDERCCLLYTSPSPRDESTSRMPSSA